MKKRKKKKSERIGCIWCDVKFEDENGKVIESASKHYSEVHKIKTNYKR